MKTIFVIGLLSTYAFVMMGQTNYLPIIKPDAQWYIGSYSCCAPPSYSKYKFDTTKVMIQEKLYNNVLYSDDSLGTEWNKTVWYLRESDGKLWVKRDVLLFDEELIVDMTALKGDTIYKNDFNSNQYLVSNVRDTTFMDGIRRKLCALKCINNGGEIFYWVEGIGDLTNVFSEYDHCVIDGGGPVLRCYEESGNNVITSQDGKPCWVSTATNDVYQRKLMMSPNPGNAYIDLMIEDNMKLPIRYRLIDINGQVVLDQLLNIQVMNIQFETNHLARGMYIVQSIDSGGHIWRGKWIKNEY